MFPCVDQEQRDPDEQVEVCDIGDIRPDLIACAAGPSDAEWEFHSWEWVDEVTDASEEESVVEVSDASCDDESESCVGNPIAWFGPLCKEYGCDGHRDECEDDKEPALSCADAEYCAGIEDKGELEELRDCDDGFVVWDEVAEV